MTSYQDCHRHLGYLTRETDIARKLLEKHGKASAQAVKELRNKTDMPMGECADMLRCLCRDMELERLLVENARLRELAEKAWKAAEMLCQAWNGPCHADGASIKPPCPLDERDELCVYGRIQRDLRELGIEVD